MERAEEWLPKVLLALRAGMKLNGLNLHQQKLNKLILALAQVPHVARSLRFSICKMARGPLNQRVRILRASDAMA